MRLYLSLNFTLTLHWINALSKYLAWIFCLDNSLTWLVAENIKCGKIQFHHSISDNKLISLQILDIGEVLRNFIEIINRKLRKEKMLDSLIELQKFRRIYIKSPSKIKMQKGQKTTHMKNL